MLDKEQHISFFRSQPVTSVCKHAWRRAEHTLTSNGCRRCRQVAFRNMCDAGVQVVVFMPPVARCWKLAAVNWRYGDESLDLHLHGVLFTGIRFSRREKLVETGVKCRQRVRLCVVNALRFAYGPVCSSASHSMIVRFQLSVRSHARDTDKRLPGLSVGPPRSVWAVGCLLMSALSPPLCTSAWRKAVRNTGLISFSRSVNASRLLASLAESDYCWLLSHSVSAEIRIPIYRIRRYASAVNEYSQIYDISLTLIVCFYGPHVLPVTHPTVAEHWKQPKPLVWPHPFIIHHWTSDGMDNTPLMLTLWH